MGDRIQALRDGEATLAVIGLGYVGLPLAVSFGKRFSVIGYDASDDRVAMLREARDPSNELDPSEITAANVNYTSDPRQLRRASVILVAVPTPIDDHHNPDLSILISASRDIGRNLAPGALVVFESTVYPGATEEVCIPVIEEESSLRCGTDFHVGYSPERINPGDREHTFERVVKVVSGQDGPTLDLVARLYEEVVEAGVHRAPDIRTAEAAKVIENTQRDLNIALMNELSIIFNRAGIDTREVLEAAGSKWNFLRFTPGLVGGHCIGVDPFYLTYKAEELGHKAQVILAGRAINDGMGKFVAENVVKGMIRCGKVVQGARVLVLGLTFKENVSDLRNSKVADVIDELRQYGVEVLVHDPLADPAGVEREMNVTPLASLEGVSGMDAVVAAVNHRAYGDLDLKRLRAFFSDNGQGVLADVRMVHSRAEAQALGLYYWSL
jgi:UDP-N-acetyl-D-galactosamine dehydrogenase